MRVYHGDGENDTFLSLLIMLKPTTESLDSGLIPASFCKTEMQNGNENLVPILFGER